METFRTNDGINASPDARLMFVQSETGEEVDIPRLDPSDAYRTLGAWIAADGSQRKQLEVLSEKVSAWFNSILCSSLNSQDKQLAYTAFLKPQIVYPIGCASIETGRLKRIFRPVMDVILHTLGLNKNFPLALVHAGPENL